MSFVGRGHGFRIDRQSYRKKRFRALRGDVSAAPQSASLELYLPPVFDQGQTGSCTAHAKVTAIMASATAQSRPLAFTPSPLELYRIARCLDRAPDARGILPALQDDGAEPGQIERAIREWGIVPMRPPAPDGRNSDCDPERINVEPLFGTLEAASHLIITGDYSIESLGPQLELEVKIALSLDHPVNVGFFADTAFDNMKPSSPPLAVQDRSDPRGGWHYATLVGYDGSRWRLRNSWGEEWGDGGDCWVGPTWLQQCVGIYASAVSEVVS